MQRRTVLLSAGMLALAPALVAHGQAIAPPTDAQLLEISGKITNTTNGKVARFDLAGLERLGKTVVKTTTKWTEGQIAFEGVPMRDLLKAVGATGSEIVAVAINDYKVTIPTADFDKYNVILAYRRDGNVMPVRDKGPLWIMYPFDDHPEIKTDLYYSRCAWQLKAIEVR
jgi:hypothetical protein